MNPPNRRVLADSNFWIGYCDAHDQYHEQCNAILDEIGESRLLIPWPVLYEVVSTRLVTRPPLVSKFNFLIGSGRLIERIDDRPYRERALDAALSWATARKRSVNLVDMVLRMMIEEQTPTISAFLTFNPADFNDSCVRARVPMIPSINARLKSRRRQ